MRAFDGAVLTGGRSRRMGRDKALVAVEGRPLARIVADALHAAGAGRVVAVGGDRPALAAAGLETIADLHPGAGPLGGVITALTATQAEIVLVAACDLPAADPTTLGAVVDALGTADVAAPRLDGRLELLHAAWHRRTLPVLDAAFAAGERAVHRAVTALEVVAVDGLEPTALADADRPEDLPR